MVQHYQAKIKNGKFYSDKELFRKRVASLPDGEYIMTLNKVSNMNTRECQNRYFALLGEFGSNYGWTKDELHNLVKDELFPELFEQINSTTDLTPDEWQVLFLHLEEFLIIKFENK